MYLLGHDARYPLQLSHISTARNLPGLSSQPLRVRTSNQRSNTSNILYLSRSSKRRPFTQSLVDLLRAHFVTARYVLGRHLSVHISLDASSGNAIDSDIAGSKIHSKTLRHTLHSCFGGSVDGMTRNALVITSAFNQHQQHQLLSSP